MDAAGALELLDWKRRIFALYAEVRRPPSPRAAWERWRAVRDELFRTHPQSPLPDEARGSYPGVPYFDYDPALPRAARRSSRRRRRRRRSARAATRRSRSSASRGRGSSSLGEERVLELYWLVAYGGGLFVPFRDDTSGAETYGGGRYLLDTVKGADLGVDGERLVLDFNFAYNPSCSYDPRWVCPLRRRRTGCRSRIEAGERMPT